MAVHLVLIVTLLMSCLAAALPLAIENPAATLPLASENSPAVKTDEVASLGPEAREEPSTSQTKPVVHQFGVAIPELQLSQFQAFDDAGHYSFGYAYPEQVRMESRSDDGLVTGSYFYKDPNGHSNQVQYLADEDGFRVSANNLPVFVPGEQPEPVRDTPEVEEAKRKHLEVWEAIAKHNQAQNAKDALEASQSISAVNEYNSDAIPSEDDKESIDIVPFASTKVERDPSPSIRPVDPDIFIDEEKQAVITEQDGNDDFDSSSVIEIDSEPIKLLAQLYSKHAQANSEPPKVIERPAGFHPQNLQPSTGFDLFSRSEGNDAIEVTNPEFVDLRAFLLTNRFRDGQQLLIRTEDKAADKPMDDLYDSDQPDPSTYAAYTLPTELYNYYFGLPYNRQIALTHETLSQLPESLKTAISGSVATDGRHDAQVAPTYNQRRQQQMLQRFYSPYSPNYSPYYFYRNANYNYNPYNTYPYYHAPVTPFSAAPYYYNYPYYSY